MGGLSCDVALRKESVDRNKYVVQCRKVMGVALRKESVDRNTYIIGRLLKCCVALRKESVDRNQGVHYDNYNLHWSLSVRRAWIEMLMYH